MAMSPQNEGETSTVGSLGKRIGGSWLRKQFSSLDSPDEPWPDLIVDKRSFDEKRMPADSRPDPVEIERTNIVKISQLVIKSVVDSSLRYGHQLDNENLALRQFFIILELAFRHGFKSGKRLVYGKRDIWDLLQQIERYDPSAGEITVSARELPTVRTSLGRSRAWFRLALMQKKLADYLKVLLENRDDLLVEYYEPNSLLSSEEGVLLSGLVVSLNIIDFNLCAKDEDLDNQETVIDLSFYLRRKEDIERSVSQEDAEVGDDCGGTGGSRGTLQPAQISTVIEQKTYIEEVNRSLNVTVSNLEARVESMRRSNAILSEDLAIANKKTREVEAENKQLSEELEKYIIEAKRKSGSSIKSLLPSNQANVSQTGDAKNQSTLSDISGGVDNWDPSQQSQFEDRLREAEIRQKDTEKELSLEIQMKAEMEMAMKLLEKDIYEKQDTIVSLRTQLEDIKSINLEMYTKLSECQTSMEYKSNIIKKLEAKSAELAETLKKLDDKFVESQKALTNSNAKIQLLTEEIQAHDDKTAALTSDLRIEREWRERLQEASLSDRDTMSKLRLEIDFLKQVSSDYENLRSENAKLRETNREQEKTLEELGQQLSWNKLQVDSLKEEVNIPGAWENDADASQCKICDKEFGIARRKHHCRNCGGIFCDSCSDNKMKLPSGAKPMRVCDNCFMLLLDRQSKMV